MNPKFSLSTLAFATALTLGGAAFATELPSSARINVTDDDISVHEVDTALRGLGYASIGQTSRDGRIFETTAVWQGETVALRIVSRTGNVRRAE